MGVDKTRHEEFPFLQTNEGGASLRAVLCEDFLKLGALYILVNPIDITLCRYAY